MSRKFKEGDVVWCTDHEFYRITCYHRPCRVMGYNENGYLLLRAFNQSNSINPDVNEELFELVPKYKILTAGQMIKLEDLNRRVKFNKYINDSYIEIIDGWLHSEYHIDNVIYEEGFYI